MSIYSGFALGDRIERIRAASRQLEAAARQLADLEHAGTSTKETLENARALLRARRLDFGGDHLEIIDVIDRLLSALERPARQAAPPAKPLLMSISVDGPPRPARAKPR